MFMETLPLLGTCGCVEVGVEVYDERLGLAYDVECEFNDINFDGWYQRDPGVRYYSDGSGDEPWSEFDITCQSDSVDLLDAAIEQVDEMYPGCVVIDSSDSLEEVIVDAMREELVESIDEYILDEY